MAHPHRRHFCVTESPPSIPAEAHWVKGARAGAGAGRRAPLVAVGRLQVWVGLAALLGWFALGSELWVVVARRLARGESLFGGFINFVSFFTVWTNSLVACVLTVRWLRPGRALDRHLSSADFSTGITASIVFVGIAYNLLLRHLSYHHGLAFLANELLHDVMPLLFLAYWWFFAERGRVSYRAILFWAIYPVLYFVYAMLRGTLFGRYPYPFIDAASIGYARAIGNALGVLVGFAVIAAILVALARWRAAAA